MGPPHATDSFVPRSMFLKGFATPVILLLILGGWLVTRAQWWGIPCAVAVFGLAILLGFVFGREVRSYLRRHDAGD